MEKWDLFDRVRQSQNRTAERGSIIAKNDFHLIIHAWVRRKSDKKLLVSKRVQNIFWGGYWQPTGGSAIAGETSKTAAIREVKEELGVDVSLSDSYFLFSYRFTPEENDNPSFFLDAWLFEIDDTQNTSVQIALQKEEVAEAKWLELGEIINLWKDGKFMPFEQTWPPYFEILSKALNKPETIQTLRAWGTAELKLSATQTPDLDSSILLSSILKCTKDSLFVHAADKATKEQIFAFSNLLFRRADGMPVAYLVGHKDFWQSTFEVSPFVLIPKPDTELLVELASKNIIDFIKQNDTKTQAKIEIADICTGSGCIGISVYLEILNNCKNKDVHFVFTDISKEALAVAQKNAQNILAENAQNISFVQGDLLEPVKPNTFDFILTNPPYVPSKITDELLKDGRREPRLALDGGIDGLDLIRRMIPQVWQALNKNGILLIETGEYNAAETRTILEKAGFTDVKTFNDLGGQPRVTQARKP